MFNPLNGRLLVSTDDIQTALSHAAARGEVKPSATVTMVAEGEDGSETTYKATAPIVVDAGILSANPLEAKADLARHILSHDKANTRIVVDRAAGWGFRVKGKVIAAFTPKAEPGKAVKDAAHAAKDGIAVA